jgi:hypothetical protein
MGIRESVIVGVIAIGASGCQSWSCNCAQSAPVTPEPTDVSVQRWSEPTVTAAPMLPGSDREPPGRKEPGAVVPPWDPKRPQPRR